MESTYPEGPSVNHAVILAITSLKTNILARMVSLSFKISRPTTALKPNKPVKVWIIS